MNSGPLHHEPSMLTTRQPPRPENKIPIYPRRLMLPANKWASEPELWRQKPVPTSDPSARNFLTASSAAVSRSTGLTSASIATSRAVDLIRELELFATPQDTLVSCYSATRSLGYALLLLLFPM